MWNKNLTGGFGLIEIIISTAIIAGSILVLTLMSITALRASGENLATVKGSFLAEEAVEAARSIRNDGWTTNISPLVVNEVYYPVFESSRWDFSTTSPGLIDGVFEREIVFEDVWRRDSDDNIVSSSSPDVKYLDSDTKKIRATVSWSRIGGATSTVELIGYLTNLFED